MKIPFTQVDAYATRPHTGNPAAVMPLDAWLPDETLQAIAAENNLSETAFTVPCSPDSGGGDADYELRWFTPTVEVNMCGHATLASGDVLMKADTIRFRTRNAGVLTVSRSGDQLALDLPIIPVAPARNPALLAALGTPDAAVFVSTGGAEDVAIILLPDAAAVRACTPDMTALREISVMAIVTASGRNDNQSTASGRDDDESATAPGTETDIVSRVFVPAWGVDEDPVTGSAHAALTPFWCDRPGRDRITAFQASARGGHLGCRLTGDRVVLTGSCVTVIQGEYLI